MPRLPPAADTPPISPADSYTAPSSRRRQSTRVADRRSPHFELVYLAALRLLGVLAVLSVLVLVWGLLARSSTPALLPGPGPVWTRFVQSLGDATYVPALLATCEEAGIGLAIALIVAVPLGYAIGRLPVLEDTLAPYLAGSQAMPIVAIAPLLVVWVGFGLEPKIIVCALISFFPILATTANGVRGVSRDLRDAARVFGASAWAMAIYVDMPLAARTVFAGLKVAAALSVTGAVVGEFVSADQGLGYLVMLGRTNFDTSLMFVALLSLVILGALAYGAVSLVERAVVRWDE